MTTLNPPKLRDINPVALATDFDCPAVTRCTNAWHRAHKYALDTGLTGVSAILRGNQAFRNAMPPLNSAENIRGFIACVAHAVLFRAIQEPTSTKLLYAAQVAASALKIKSPRKPKTSQSKPHSRRAPAKNATLPPPSGDL